MYPPLPRDTLEERAQDGSEGAATSSAAMCCRRLRISKCNTSKPVRTRRRSRARCARSRCPNGPRYNTSWAASTSNRKTQWRSGRLGTAQSQTAAPQQRKATHVPDSDEHVASIARMLLVPLSWRSTTRRRVRQKSNREALNVQRLGTLSQRVAPRKKKHSRRHLPSGRLVSTAVANPLLANPDRPDNRVLSFQARTGTTSKTKMALKMCTTREHCCRPFFCDDGHSLRQYGPEQG